MKKLLSLNMKSSLTNLPPQTQTNNHGHDVSISFGIRGDGKIYIYAF